MVEVLEDASWSEVVTQKEVVRAVFSFDEFVIHRRAVELPKYRVGSPPTLLQRGDLRKRIGSDGVRQAVIGYPRIELLALVVPEVKTKDWVASAGGLDDGVNM